ncbi:hypothetical protein D9V32_15780 [Mycetocola tolaasinivorans]|uniref:Uncharacterized protein n=1 Tax=Mycetocola tolaasinivorans TaxID=76635 RepID=A0A3L6ZVP7_9MICO|nr:hypothetical protein [Mycetocola tolaasinivorans]RLP71888.1 hypothetical protein D9V32_15780 [Mycetocola tolaasinivorans]
MFGFGTGDRSRVAFWWLIGVLAASGVAMAFVVAFGEFGSVGFSITWRVFVADLYLIAALAAQHVWLRRTIWIGAGITFLLGIITVLWPGSGRNRWSQPYYEYGNTQSGWSPWDGFLQDLETALHICVGGLVVLGFLSLAYRWLKGERVLRITYLTTFGLGVASILIAAIRTLDSRYRMNLGEGLSRVHTALIILALTGAAIVIIAGFVQRRTILARERLAASPVEASPAPAVPEATVPVDNPELRALVRTYVEEYLREREQYRRE